ncbi:MULTISPECIES: S1C family serine protease [Bacillus]|uniref:S1C family serine protease n=1 Tax=Bacillus TaxID=1386 RepID=UPI0002D9A2A3|nr:MULTISPECIES: trypsin-like peptidase domain-containing protein [Bacillus]
MSTNENNNQFPGQEPNDHPNNSLENQNIEQNANNEKEEAIQSYDSEVASDKSDQVEEMSGSSTENHIFQATAHTSDEQNNSQSIKQEQSSRNQKKKGKNFGFVKTVAAGVIGSVITLSVIPFTDYPDMFNSNNNTTQQESKSEYSSTGSKNVVNVKNSASSESNTADVIEKALPAIVGIVNIQKQNQNNFFFPQDGQQSQQQSGEGVETGSGSGVIFKKDSKNAYIVTNNHVIEDADEIEISLANGEKTKAQLVGTDALSDLAVLTIDAKYAESTLDFGDSSVLRAGEQVVAIGNPLGLDFSRTVTQGIVSATDRAVAVSTSAGEWEMNVIQTDAAINAGNSGGALINTSGQVIGINSMKISESGVEGLGFAIPSNDVVPIINEIIDKGKVERVYVGVGLASLEEIPQYYLQNVPEKAKSGVMVTSVDPNSAAAKAGIQVQDIIVSINNTEVKSSTEFRKYLYGKLKVGDKATIKLYRQGQLKTVEVTLTANTGVTS